MFHLGGSNIRREDAAGDLREREGGGRGREGERGRERERVSHSAKTTQGTDPTWCLSDVNDHTSSSVTDITNVLSRLNSEHSVKEESEVTDLHLRWNLSVGLLGRHPVNLVVVAQSLQATGQNSVVRTSPYLSF